MNGVEKGIELTIQAPREVDSIERMKERGGVLLGDLVVGGLSVDGRKRVRIDVPAEDGVGGLFLDLDMSVAGSRKGYGTH